jgi:hypothetical protein
MTRRLLPALLGVALLAGCGTSSTTYDPVAPAGPGAAAGSTPAAKVRGNHVELTVRSGQRYVSGRWSSAGRSGKLKLVRRVSGGYVVSAPRPRGAAAVDIDVQTFLPYLKTTGLTLARKPGGGVKVAPRAIPAAATTKTVHVSPSGDDQGDGSSQDPLKTIAAGVKAAGPGGTVMLADGDYPRFTDADPNRAEPVRIVAERSRGARIAGADVGGAANLKFDGLVFTNMVALGDDGRPARDITITNSELTTDRKAVCMIMRGGSQNITLTYNWVHDCDHGLTGPGPSKQSRHITISGNRFEHFDLDGIQFVNWSDVTIDRNTIREMHDPAGKNHADGIQSIGGNRRVTITHNEISDSRHQLILVQDSLSGPSRNVTIESNLLHGAGSNALDAISVYGLRVTGNTIWHSRGGIFVDIGKSGQPRRNLFAGNIVSLFYVTPRTRQPMRRDNVLGDSNGATASGEVVESKPGFRGRSFSLAPDAVSRDTDAARWLPQTDLYGLPRRTGTPGAID